MSQSFDGQASISLANQAYAQMGIARRTVFVDPAPSDCLLSSRGRVILVDDTPMVFEAFIEPLLAAAQGNAMFFLHRGESLEDLVGQIVKAQPGVLLLDGQLAGGLCGWELLPGLRDALPALMCIGFSTDNSLSGDFLAADADGFVRKDVGDPFGTLRQVARLLSGG